MLVSGSLDTLSGLRCVAHSWYFKRGGILAEQVWSTSSDFSVTNACYAVRVSTCPQVQIICRSRTCRLLRKVLVVLLLKVIGFLGFVVQFEEGVWKTKCTKCTQRIFPEDRRSVSSGAVRGDGFGILGGGSPLLIIVDHL